MSYISKGRRYTYGVKTLLSDVSSITGMSSGDTVFCLENDRLLTYDGQVWMCNDFVKLNNGTATSWNRGDVVVVSTAVAGGRAARTTTAGDALVVGPVVFGGASGNPAAIAVFGIYGVLTESSTDAGDYARTSTTAGAASSTTTVGAGFFGVFTEQKASAQVTKCVLRSKIEFF